MKNILVISRMVWMVWLGGSSGSVLIDLREKIKNSLTRGKLRNSLARRGRNSVRVYIYKVERVKRKVSKRFFPVDIEEMYADVSLCAESIRWMEREREENKYRATKRGENPSLPTQVPPSAPPVCLTALAYGHECQCFSRKHDLGWNNPFGKGLRLSSSVSFFSPFFLSVCSVRLSVQQRLFTAVVATCTPRVARSNLI